MMLHKSGSLQNGSRGLNAEAGWQAKISIVRNEKQLLTQPINVYCAISRSYIPLLRFVHEVGVPLTDASVVSPEPRVCRYSSTLGAADTFRTSYAHRRPHLVLFAMRRLQASALP